MFREINAFTSCVGTHPGKVVESRCKVFFFPFKLGFFFTSQNIALWPKRLSCHSQEQNYFNKTRIVCNITRECPLRSSTVIFHNCMVNE